MYNMWCAVRGDGQFNTSHADTLYLFLNNTIARHCTSHNNTTVWVVDLQNGIISSVNIPHNYRHFISIVNTDLAFMNRITIVSISTTILPDLQISDMCVHTYLYNDMYVYSTSVCTVHILYTVRTSVYMYVCTCVHACDTVHIHHFLINYSMMNVVYFPIIMVNRHAHTAHANPTHKGNM